MRPEKSLGEQNYELFARRYAAAVPTKPHNAYLERPATLSLLPNVRGLRVLDVGCGPGIYAEWLLDHGARVVSFDVTAEFVAITREKVGDRLEALHRHDVTHPLSFAEDQSFDLVVCPLVLDYVEDWRGVFREFYRVLKPGGVLVVSHGHPQSDFQVARSSDYFATELYSMEWKGFGEPYPRITSYRRPLQEMLNPLIEAGFQITRVQETRPTEAFRQAAPEDYEKYAYTPTFLCVRAVKG